MSESLEKDNHCVGLKERIEFNQDFKLDWHDKDEIKDGYQLKWIGKDYARLQSGMMTETVIIPNNEHNNKEENKNSKNLFFTGDNLEVLRHLQNAYSNSIKMIYIDPPYNTGSEFVYNDTFEFSDEKLKEMLGFTDEEIKRLHTINGRSSHSAWLTFMYPRLKIAQKLLTEDGGIFISIDDNEQANLKLLCDEIFGEENFIAKIMTVANPGGRDYTQIAIQHEYILIYGKSYQTELNEIPKDIIFKLFDNNGGFELRDLRNRNPKFNSSNRPNLFYPFYINPSITDNNGFCSVSLNKDNGYEIEVSPFNSKGNESVWRWGKEKANNSIKKDNPFLSEIVAKKKRDGSYNIYEKCRKATTNAKSIWDETEMRTEDGTRLINELFSKAVFPHPKPLELVKKCIEIGSNDNDIIMDFFAGSATTAHSIMKSNSLNKTKRVCVSIQLPEEIFELNEKGEKISPKEEISKNAFEMGFSYIDEISRKRIELSANKIKEETNADIDYGYKHYYVKEVDVNTINKIEEFDPTFTKLIADNMVQEFDNEFSKGKDVIFTTWLVADGYKLDKEVEIIDFEGYKAHYIDNSLLYLIDTNWNCNQTKQLLNLIGERKLNINTIIVYGYSFTLESLKELEIAIKQNFDNKIQIEKRY